MRIEFESAPTLPLLAWCARVRRGGDVRVRHGEGVEVKGSAFAEGAWDGDFERFVFDEAVTFTGTGGRLRRERMVFASPTHPLEPLWVMETEKDLFVSNSLAFLFVESGDGPDIRYPNYFFDLLRHARSGVAAPATKLRTAAGRQVGLYHVCNLELADDLSYRRTPKPLPAAPTCYADYYSLLFGSVKAVAENAVDPARCRTYRLVASISKGFDSTAAAALAAQAGARESVSYLASSLDGNLADDSGAEAARHLGMEPSEYDRLDALKLPSLPEAEFFTSPGGFGGLGLRVMESQLAGALFTNGRHGECYWGPTSKCDRTALREPDEMTLAGRGLTDFRIRTGYLDFPVPYIGALHGRAIYRITHSQEMRPWLLGVGLYDRPIARRIAEDAGVPRSLFGHVELGGGGRALRRLSKNSDRDLRAFCEATVPADILRRLDPRPPFERDRSHYRLVHLRARHAHKPVLGKLLDWTHSDRWHAMWKSLYLYRFHWGFERIRQRYEV